MGNNLIFTYVGRFSYSDAWELYVQCFKDQNDILEDMYLAESPIISIRSVKIQHLKLKSIQESMIKINTKMTQNGYEKLTLCNPIHYIGSC